jgi:hypothetical protein
VTTNNYNPQARIARLIREEHLERTVATGAAVADFIMAVHRALRPAPAAHRPATGFTRKSFS